MKHEVRGIPPRKNYLTNLENKMKDPDFLGDTTAILRPDENYNPDIAYLLIKKELIDRM